MGTSMFQAHNMCQAHALTAVPCGRGCVDDSGMDNNKIFGNVIKQFRKAAGLTQPQLSEKSGVDQGAVSRIENGKLDSPHVHLDALSEALGIRPSEVLQAVENIEDAAANNFTPPPIALPGMKTIPLIGWVRAGKWDQVENPFDPEVAEGYVQTAVKVSKHAFALRVKGESMMSLRESVSFPPGTTIIVEPQAFATDGSLIIAALEDDEEATFKKLVSDGGRQYLVPLNPQYPTLPVDRPMRICGVIVAIAERSIQS